MINILNLDKKKNNNIRKFTKNLKLLKYFYLNNNI